MESASITKENYKRLARAVLEWTLKDITKSPNPEVVANVFFSVRGQATLFCGLAEIDEDTFKNKCYELVTIRENELYTKEGLKKLERHKKAMRMIAIRALQMRCKHEKKIKEVEKWIKTTPRKPRSWNVKPKKIGLLSRVKSKVKQGQE